MVATQPELYDLLILTDATASMGSFLTSLKTSLPDIIRISAATGCFSRIGVLAYRDYDHSKVTTWSGWLSSDDQSGISQKQLLSFVDNLEPSGGADWPEATKTGLAHAYDVMRPDAKTIMLVYTDAPPHTRQRGGYWQDEQKALLTQKVHGATSGLFADWASAAQTLSSGEKRAQVFTLVHVDVFVESVLSMYIFLSTVTGGVCLALSRQPSPTDISKVTVNLLLAWMGAIKQGAGTGDEKLVTYARYLDTSGIGQVKSEEDEVAAGYRLNSNRHKHDGNPLLKIEQSQLSLATLPQVIPSREHPIMDFAKRYQVDPEYRSVVTKQLGEIIESDVSAIALNPVFGSLWRTVCNDRGSPDRDLLVTRFGLHVDKIEDAEKKARMKKWLEESYDWAEEILGIVKSVPEEARYPCVFLDPTVRFAPTGRDAGAEEGDDSGSMEFTREELLEIGRSCDYRILRRLGRILTRLAYVTSKEELPAHIREVGDEQVPRIPLALADEAHKRKFWQVLLHTVLPGTMLSARPAALLAALSVRIGMKPLEEVAYKELMAWRDKWNTLDIPETWNSSCLGLLLEADRKHRQSLKDAGLDGADAETILKVEDRKLFETLVDCKLLELNMETTLTAQVGWNPDKAKVALGPVVVCKTCCFPRSVTIMAQDGVCGVCASVDAYTSKEQHAADVKTNVSATDDHTTPITWVECAMTDCRAQYVVYLAQKLRVRPKCHYCRTKSSVSTTESNHATTATAPCVTCTTCLNRVIWPEAYRPSTFDPTTYTCPACTAGAHKTITPAETTAHALSKENGTAWLLLNKENAIREPFSNRSLFHTISTSPFAENRAEFPSHVTVLPQTSETENLTFTLRGKPIHNTSELLASLRSWITARRVERGTCSLCFGDFPKRNLRPACGGRKGCRQVICGGCMEGWYGLNRPGRVINLAALSCPFCRRQPVAGKVKLPDGLQFLGGLRDAVEERGEWVYAWCFAGCGNAVRMVERVCAQGAPAEVEGWVCEVCREAEAAAREKRGEGERELVIKECPSCGVATEKSYGCDHITCQCGKHWCFNCGEKVADTAGEIYEHMTEVHRTWFSGGEDPFAYDEEDEYYGTDDEEM